MSNEKTTVTTVEVDNIDQLLDINSAANILLPEDDKKPNFFSKQRVDLGFLTPKKPEVKAPAPTPAAPAAATPVLNEPVAAIPAAPITPEDTPGLENIIKEVDGTPDPTPEAKTGGRPKIDKDGAIELVKKLIESKSIVPFEDEKKIEDYTLTDIQELIEANFKDREQRIMEETPKEFYQSLSEELQIAAKYEMDGGKDMRGLFKILAQAEDSKALSPEEPKDQESITREYLLATNFGTREEVEDQITEWKDLNKLPEKAEKFKPKLDALRSEIINKQLADQELLKRQRATAAQNYANSIYKVLEPAELNGIKLDKKVQGLIYSGLVQPNYPSISGSSTNLLGHLLEKYQFVEPNHALIAEALWLLADPDDYHKKLKEGGKTDATVATVRLLKTEQSNKIASTPVVEKEETTQRRIPRSNNFFKR